MATMRKNGSDARLSKDIEDFLKKLKALGKEFEAEEKRKILEYAALPMVRQAQALAPQSQEAHKRYDTPKLTKRLRAPKGMGKVVAEYLPGNLKMSVEVMKHGIFKKLKNVVFIGPKLARRGARGKFGRSKFDGYYAHWLEFGTRFMKARPFMRPAFQATKGVMLKRVELALRLKLQKFIAKNKV